MVWLYGVVSKAGHTKVWSGMEWSGVVKSALLLQCSHAGTPTPSRIIQGSLSRIIQGSLSRIIQGSASVRTMAADYFLYISLIFLHYIPLIS